MKCLECGPGKLKKNKGNYLYKESGLSNIVLVNIPMYRCDACKETEVEIPATEELHNMLSFMLLLKPTQLNGEEARFLRKNMGYTEKDLAKKLGVTRVTLSRWENAKGALKTDRDKHLRLFFLSKKGNDLQKTPGVVQLIKSLVSYLPFQDEKDQLKLYPEDWMSLSPV